MGSKAAGSGGQSGGMGGGMGMGGGDVQPFNMPPTANPYGTDAFPFAGGGKGWQPPFPPQQPQQPPNGMPQGQPDGVWGGANVPHHMSDDDYLQMMYQTQLGRQGDQGGMDYWRGQLGSGAVNRDQLAANFHNSAEGQQYAQAHPMLGQMDEGYGYGPYPNQPGQMDQQILDALNLAQQRQAQQAFYQQQGQGGNQPGQQYSRPDISQALALLGRLFG